MARCSMGLYDWCLLSPVARVEDEPPAKGKYTVTHPEPQRPLLLGAGCATVCNVALTFTENCREDKEEGS